MSNLQAAAPIWLVLVLPTLAMAACPSTALTRACG